VLRLETPRRFDGGPIRVAVAAFIPAFLAIATALAAHAVAPGVLGHEGVPRLILEPARVNPGGVLTVRVEDLPPEAMVSLSMGGDRGSVDLATVAVDPEGHATVFVEVPADIERGLYTVTGEADGVVVSGVEVVVEGPVIGVVGEPGEKDEDDGLLVELPPGWQQSLSGPIVTARPLTETLPAGSAGRGSVDNFIVAIAIGVSLASVVLIVASRLRQRA
jgi:hypothetical protein